MKYKQILFFYPETLIRPDTAPPRPFDGTDALLEYLNRSGCSVIHLAEGSLGDMELPSPSETLCVGTTQAHANQAANASLPFALALWSCTPTRHIRADYYPVSPWDLINLLTRIDRPYEGMDWLPYAMELQFIAQAGLTYSKDCFDRERFLRLREISAELMSLHTRLPVGQVTSVFCSETGFQTPKLDTRAAIFQDGRILLVKETSGRWSLPGGWVDVNQSVYSNTVKEVQEEAGLDVIPTRLIAVQDRNRHNVPVYAYGVCKVFILCDPVGGSFVPNTETTESDYFLLEEVPELAEEKNNYDQIAMCFDAYRNENWKTVFD